MAVTQKCFAENRLAENLILWALLIFIGDFFAY
jgi:hypothetical protein